MFCLTSAAACNDTDIQLVGGRNNFEGRVEVCFRGHYLGDCDWTLTGHLSSTQLTQIYVKVVTFLLALYCHSVLHALCIYQFS